MHTVYISVSALMLFMTFCFQQNVLPKLHRDSQSLKHVNFLLFRRVCLEMMLSTFLREFTQLKVYLCIQWYENERPNPFSHWNYSICCWNTFVSWTDLEDDTWKAKQFHICFHNFCSASSPYLYCTLNHGKMTCLLCAPFAIHISTSLHIPSFYFWHFPREKKKRKHILLFILLPLRNSFYFMPLTMHEGWLVISYCRSEEINVL